MKRLTMIFVLLASTAAWGECTYAFDVGTFQFCLTAAGTLQSIAGISVEDSWRTIANFGECDVDPKICEYTGHPLGAAVCQPNGLGTLPIIFGCGSNAWERVTANPKTRTVIFTLQLPPAPAGIWAALTYRIAKFPAQGDWSLSNNFASSKSAAFVWPIFGGQAVILRAPPASAQNREYGIYGTDALCQPGDCLGLPNTAATRDGGAISAGIPTPFEYWSAGGKAPILTWTYTVPKPGTWVF